ncbi:hypothetical protein GO755_00255 [Spirosoma sp. HMF4905]|uniref:Uncharacterized protein n=1 Tax=Spirosoma arboris TaxID=2682092 RepID=A0A7K1S3P3_9BACT|nr:hypothetical protein [Spirosoma arboris]MVM28442.1 hypothetical protein [Spirosoma arboris]
MNRADKIRVLQDAFLGNDGSLRKVQRDRRMKSMPFKEALGVVDIRELHPGFLDLPIVDTEILIDSGRRAKHEPLRNYLERYKQVDPQQQHRFGAAAGTIDVDDKSFDHLPLTHIRLVNDSSWCFTQHPVTVGKLREYFLKTAESTKLSFLTLWFDCNTTGIYFPNKRNDPNLS